MKERGPAQACNGLAKSRLEFGDLGRAEVLFTRALHLRQDLGYRRGVGLSRRGLGWSRHIASYPFAA